MHPPASTATLIARSRARALNAYQSIPARSDRAQRCSNRNGVWPPAYKRQWNPHPPRSLANNAQAQWQRCVQDAVAAGELHRTTGAVLLALSRPSDSRLNDVWIAQATIGEHLGLAPSTVCHHVAIAKRCGWVAVQHRNRIDNGVVVGMSNVTRFEFPEQWRTMLDEQHRSRVAAQARTRRRQSHRTTAPSHQDSDEPRRPSPSPHTHAADAGAAVARLATTTDFEHGRRQLADLYSGQPGLYEAAYDSFVETWKTVRRNE